METRKRTAVLLAVLFGFWAWLYTFNKRDYKFWVAYGIFLIASCLCILFRTLYKLFDYTPPPGEFYDDPTPFVLLFAYLSVAFIAWIITWLPAIIVNMVKSPERYATCSEKDEETALCLAILSGPFCWLYTYNYNKDALKFWTAIVILTITFLLVPTVYNYTNTAYSTLWQYFQEFFHRPGMMLSELLPYLVIEYYFKAMKPISLIIPACLWAVAVLNSAMRYLASRRNYASTSNA